MHIYNVVINACYETEDILDYEEFNTSTQGIWKDFLKQYRVKRAHIDIIEKRSEKIILAEFTPEEILPYVNKKIKKDFTIDNVVYHVRLSSDRFFVFKDNVRCMACGLLGTIMRLELYKNDKSPHFNLYGIEDGKYVLMTVDHIKAYSKSKDDSIDNKQTLCKICNSLKGDEDLDNEKLKKLRELYNANVNLPRKELAQLIRESIK